MNTLDITHEEVVNFLKSLGFVVDETEVLKEGKKMIGTMVRRSKEDRIAPTIYIDSEIEYAKSQGADRQQLLMAMLRLIRLGFDGSPETESIDEFFTPESFKENARLGVRKITPDSNELKRPSAYDGLEEYVYMIVETPNIHGLIKINKSHLNHLETTEDDAFEIARANSHKETAIMHMADYVLASHKGEEGIEELTDVMRESLMFVITTTFQLNSPEINHLGASAMLDKEAIAEFSEQIGVDKFVVIPASTREAMLVPCEDDVDIDMYKQMVCMVNSTEVAPSEVLIDAAYIIDCNTMEIAA